MALWIGGLPLLFWHRWPKLTLVYGAYAVVFIIVSQASRYWLGECFLTTIARHFWTNGPARGIAVTDEWFTVRFAQLVFRLTPSHRSIVWASEALIAVTAVGGLFSLRRRMNANTDDAGRIGPKHAALAGSFEERSHRL
jgi:hypothetical protein